jgi:hypothetical protein
MYALPSPRLWRLMRAAQDYKGQHTALLKSNLDFIFSVNLNKDILK